jgi:hypothetical protein
MNELKSELRSIAKIGGLAVLFTLAFFLLLIIHEHLWKSEIVFYGYIKMLFLCFAGMVIILFVLHRNVHFFKARLRISEIIISACFSLLLSFVICFTFPVTVDRSFSVFMIGSLYKYEEPVPIDEFKEIVSRYFYGQNMVGKRINEQLATKSIEISGGDKMVQLTKRGRFIANSFKLVGKIFNLDMTNISPE